MNYKRWLLEATVIFVLGIAAGLATPPGFISEDIIGFEDIESLAELSPSVLTIFILFKNLFFYEGLI